MAWWKWRRKQRSRGAAFAAARRVAAEEKPVEIGVAEHDAFLETCHEVGGDLYDFHVRADGRLVFVVGDVSGKGMGAALLMSSFLASARVLYDVVDDVGELASRLGTLVCRTAGPGRFITGFVGVLDPATGELRYVNAGHPSPCLVRDGALRELESTGVPFGILPEWTYTSAAARLEPGETMAIFSDGIPEAQRGEEFFDEDRLREALSAARGPLPDVRRELLGRVEAFLQGAPRTDDLTLVLLRREGS